MELQDYKEPEKKRRGMWPILGLILGIAAAMISYVVTPFVLTYIRQRSPRFSVGTLSESQVELLFGAIVFLVIVSIATLIVAAAAPKKKSQVSEAALVKQRNRIEAEKRAKRKRQLEMNRKMRDQTTNRLDG